MPSNSPPRTRLRAQKQISVIDLTSSSPPAKPTSAPVPPTPLPRNSADAIQPLPARLTTSHTQLSPASHHLLLHKRSHLQKYSVPVPRDFRKHSPSTVSSTLVFAQEQAGTAVCVSSSGLLLTCAHCVSDENDEQPSPESLYWLLFASGRTVATRCVAWDARRDLALLRVVAAQQPRGGDAAGEGFPCVEVAETGPAVGDGLVCVGHPGSEDLEVEDAGVETGYDVLHLSTGLFRGYAEGQDLQDNSEIGALQHDCWTYWGHSGAPLFDRRSGKLVGLHSSWDDETAMRRGVAWEAIVAFMDEHRGV
ncbi:Trypsin-like serine protease [Coniochaeta hoffmannii]|uniref:Trypsin-like serine protease n=1 Tax=Coniochaeta hoffmannii TaxID=91930 RepID=A0AA38VD37_9PEZI|nr:Trypsin-like serine protease [Coniochaeta hoffmannii]